MIHHCVFFSFRDDVSHVERDSVLIGLRELVDEIPGLRSLSFGGNADFENKSPQYRDGFVAVFEDRESLATYADHPRHVELGGRLVDACVNGHDGIIVFDIVSG